MTWGPRRQRPFGWYVARTMIPRTVVFLALAAAMLVGQALGPDSVTVRAADPAPPVWTLEDAVDNPACVPSADWPPGRPAAGLVVHRSAGAPGERMPFDAAWALNHDAVAGNDVWVVGVCP
jgi:hypothetical protein